MMRSLVSKKFVLALLCAAVLVVGLSACGGDDDSSSSGNTGTTAAAASGDQSGGAVAVTIQGFAFDAQPVTAGSTFKVENKDSTDHTFTADDGSFDVNVPAGKTVTVTAPASAGTYAYHCKIHSSMKGDLTVS